MDFQFNTPIYLQVAEDLKRRLLTGTLRPGDRLPSVADLAAEYRINPNTVQRVYHRLEEEGACFTKRGIGTFLTEDPAFVSRLRQETEERLVSEFLAAMQTLGYSVEEILQTIQTRKEGPLC